jgi:type II secretory pathway pseudopilin PulG
MTCPIRINTRRRGYFFLEMVILLAVLGVFAVVADKLMVTTLTAIAQAQHREETARRFDLAINQLRSDVWSARLIEADGQSATLHEPDGAKIVWHVEPQVPDDGSGAPDPFGPSIRLTRRVERGNAVSSDKTPATVPATATDATEWEPLPAGIAFAADGPTLTTQVPSIDEHLERDARSQIAMISQSQFLAGRKP